MKILLGSDHGGFKLKEKVMIWLENWDYQFEDLGAFEHQADDDYPDFAFKVAKEVAKLQQNGQPTLGVLLCRSGGGMTIAANKVAGIRAVPVHSPREAKHARHDNDANVISLAGDWLDDKTAKITLKTFLETPFSQEERHQRRIDKINNYQQDQ